VGSHFVENQLQLKLTMNWVNK